MSNKKLAKKNKFLSGKMILVEVGVIGVLLVAIVLIKNLFKEEIDTSEGEAYVASMEERNPAAVLEQINNVRAAVNQEQGSAEPASDSLDGTEGQDSGVADTQSTEDNYIPSEMRESLFAEQAAGLYAQIDSLEIADLSPEQLAWYQQRFANTVVVGDSLAQAVYDNGFLDGSHVYFERGASIRDLDEELAEAAAMLPTNIIFYTGLNDTDKIPDVNEFAAEYMNKVQQAEALCPGANIYICSMVNPSDELALYREDLARAPEYDAMLRYVCDNSSATYIDLKWMVRQSLYLEDGIHFNYDFYTIWMQYVDMNIN